MVQYFRSKEGLAVFIPDRLCEAIVNVIPCRNPAYIVIVEPSKASSVAARSIVGRHSIFLDDQK